MAANYYIDVNGLQVEVVRKAIRNLNLSVYASDGRVRISAPRYASNREIREFVTSNLSWIAKQQARFRARPRPSQPSFLTGESHYFMGRPYRLEVVERYGRHDVALNDGTDMVLYVRPGTSRANRKAALREWYRRQLKQCIPPLIRKWEPVIGVEVDQWGVKKMKTRWGSCNIDANRIWLNLELASKPPACLEFILVHEMVHLRVRRHNRRFKAYMDKYLPLWREHRKLLYQTPPGHEDWHY
jgi:predicted metal-dependent hydrolase